MSDDTWLRDALRRAVEFQPSTADRAGGALALAARWRRQRVLVASCAAAFAVLVALGNVGGSGSASLEPVTPPVPGSTGPAARSASPAATVPRAAVQPRAEQPASGTAAPQAAPGATPPGMAGVARPARPRVELFVLADASSSDQAIAAVASAVEQVQAGLLGAGLDLHAGFGFYQDGTPGLIPGGYTRARPIAPGAVDVRGTPARGNGYAEEPWTQGLAGAVSGARAAGFSSTGNVTKIVLLFADSAADQAAPYPTVGNAGLLLGERGVHVVSVGVVDLPVTASSPYADMTVLADFTDTYSARATDCDGDGDVDVPKGQAMICSLNVAQQQTDWTVLGETLATLYVS